MTVVTFNVDHRDTPKGVIALIGREWYGVAALKHGGSKRGEVWGVAFGKSIEDITYINFDEIIPQCSVSADTIGTCVAGEALTGDEAEQYVAYQLTQLVMTKEKEILVRRARADRANDIICQMQEMLETAEQQLNQLNVSEEGLTEEQYERLRSAHASFETLTTDLDHVVDPD